MKIILIIACLLLVNTVYSRQSSERFLSKKRVDLSLITSTETTQHTIKSVSLTNSNLSIQSDKESKIMKSSLSFQPLNLLVFLLFLFSQIRNIKRVWVKTP